MMKHSLCIGSGASTVKPIRKPTCTRYSETFVLVIQTSLEKSRSGCTMSSC